MSISIYLNAICNFRILNRIKNFWCSFLMYQNMKLKRNIIALIFFQIYEKKQQAKIFQNTFVVKLLLLMKQIGISSFMHYSSFLYQATSTSSTIYQIWNFVCRSIFCWLWTEVLYSCLVHFAQFPTDFFPPPWSANVALWVKTATLPHTHTYRI